ncbi:uridine 5'-monophosphate synthase-like isoform X2 [Corticium candelabrum]|uniref:uridine 5'-monophosphate synthase-like isoform X2 n=1 Tax=Corticium candelabrum TaxID=121492 RepID=UPI002E26BF15|nr:uridine 5'-monophosphate synthase-like isoform X2 [Corticium candelabrum]
MPVLARQMDLVELSQDLFSINAVKFGNFTLKSGIQSPVYFDLRVLVSHPTVLAKVSEQIWLAANRGRAVFDSVCGVPYTALPLATQLSVQHNVPMLMKRNEAKDHGTKKSVEGSIIPGSKCLVIEDVVTSGGSVYETVQVLQKEGLIVTDAVVFLDREQSGKARLKEKGITLHSVLTVTQLLSFLESSGVIDAATVARVQEFVKANQFTAGVQPQLKTKVLTYEERAAVAYHPLCKTLFTIMHEKKTNLIVSIDLTSCKEILKLLNDIGPYICMVKVHVDIVEDFSREFANNLGQLGLNHNFLVLEDRKFADIGNTAQHQYTGGVFQIVHWANLVTVHSLPGPGVVKSLRDAAHARERGCLLIAEMSSKGHLLSSDYTKASVSMAQENKDFVVGFICTHKVSEDAGFIYLTPGVSLSQRTDGLDQQYLTPEEVVKVRGCDGIIVGRGIYQAANAVEAAISFQKAGYQAYEELLQL